MKTPQEDAEHKYADIIHLDRPEDPEIFRKHPRMPVSERAKIFAPFAALRGYSEHLAAEDGKLLRTRHIDFSEDEITKLSEKLKRVSKNMEITVIYFLPDPSDPEYGYYTKLQGKVKNIDFIYRNLKIDGTLIAFGDLADITFNESS